MKKTIIYELILIYTVLLFASCKSDDVVTPEQNVENALDSFVSSLVATPPTAADVSARVKQYMQTIAVPPQYFYGSTVTLLDTAGLATYSPYWYRSADSLLTLDLAADTAYQINNQLWLRQPIDGGVAIWTAPYFDAGGGNIWMKTRAVPVVVNGRIIAVATTDLPTQ
jgi:hypothetical protein